VLLPLPPLRLITAMTGMTKRIPANGPHYIIEPAP